MPAAGAIKAGSAYVEIPADLTKLDKGLSQAKGKLEKFGKEVGAIGLKLMAASAAILVPLTLAAKKFADYGDRIAKLSRRTGVGTEALSALGYAAEIAGASLDAVEKGMRRLARSMMYAERGMATTLDAFKMLGLTYDELRGRKPEEQFAMLAAGISKVEDASLKAGLAQEIFGRAGTELIPLLDMGAEGLRRYADEALRAGKIIDAETAVAAEGLQDAFTRLKASAEGLAIHIGSKLAPAFELLAATMSEAANKALATSKKYSELSSTIANASLTLGILAGALGAAALAMAAASKAASVLGVALGPVSAAIGIISVGTGYLITKIESVLGPLRRAREEGHRLGREMEAGAKAAKAQADALDAVAKGGARAADSMEELRRRLKAKEKEAPEFPLGILGTAEAAYQARLAGYVKAQAKVARMRENILSLQRQAAVEGRKLTTDEKLQIKDWGKTLRADASFLERERKRNEEFFKAMKFYFPGWKAPAEWMKKLGVAIPQRARISEAPRALPTEVVTEPRRGMGAMGTFSGALLRLMGTAAGGGDIPRRQLHGIMTLVDVTRQLKEEIRAGLRDSAGAPLG